MRIFFKHAVQFFTIGVALECGMMWAQQAKAPAEDLSPAPSAPSTSVKADVPAAKHADVLPDETYIVGIEDELQISVWKELELSGPVVVRPDGIITMPLLNDIAVVGMTTKQIQDVLTEKLKPFVTEPQVTVIVRNIRSRKVYLVGQIARAGAFQLNGTKTVLQMIVEAGGVGQFAKADHIYILRTTGGRQERLNFSYKRALKGTDPKADFPLLAGDIIVVP